MKDFEKGTYILFSELIFLCYFSLLGIKPEIIKFFQIGKRDQVILKIFHRDDFC